MLYPVLCTPVFKKMIWGSESWDVTCREKEMSVIENGPDAGLTLAEWFAADRFGTLGTRGAARKKFPLLVKIIDARDDLSIQVHPDDAYARDKNGVLGDSGKNEMWYILKAPESGCLIIGLNEGVTREDLKRACGTGVVDKLLNRLPVKRGDMIDIPAGLVHALTRGVMVAEIQQNSDITYRLYDYNRPGPDGKPRELHVEAALDVSDFENTLPKEAVPGHVISNRYFYVAEQEINGSVKMETNPETFGLLTCVEGSFTVKANGVPAGVSLYKTVFIPAGLGEYIITGSGKMLLTRI